MGQQIECLLRNVAERRLGGLANTRSQFQLQAKFSGMH